MDNADARRPPATPGRPKTGDLAAPAGSDGDGNPRSDTQSDHQQLRGPDLARAALAAARAASGGPEAKKNKVVRRGAGAVNRRRRRWSGAGADERDPQPLGRIASRVALERGWSGRLTTGRLFDRWSQIVGEEVAEHAQPVELKGGELTVQADSTAWATQLRLLQKQLLAKIAGGVGHDVVKRLKVLGPTAPSWRFGTRHVRGRGPRDTYG
ncbi:DciA family protein [Actinophytocola glycyrrhizae]|uniref:DciA family protein n=1 Tax=Actinophytocola glycyrrhizae TaxID=2044873 RepID=A0ABV9RZT2_9PSEU